ncbi:MAG: hypothetical protein EZS28_049993 [Streblomastix strix]|uniref:Uncharacterized protein n=1 Tax=Streblomastix strix TaxID=222440 RepID=A0A5J4TA95_9EUKA|nr:MAG: hypothetical protein EZS28_049993 [Streblomastix strix]
MNVGVRLEEKEQEKEREDELNRMRDDVELKEELQMRSFLKEKEKENRSFKDNSNLQEKETDGLSLYQCGSRKKLGAQCGTSLNDGKQKKKRVAVEQRHFFDIGWQQQLDAHIERLANLFTDAHANIVMTGIYQSLHMMVNFVSGRMIAPSSKIEPGQDLELSISTNGCFKKLEDM